MLTDWNSTQYWLHWTTSGSSIAVTSARRLKRETQTWNSNVKYIRRVLWFCRQRDWVCAPKPHKHKHPYARWESERPNWMLKHVWIRLNDVNHRLVIMIAQRANMHEVNVNDFQTETHRVCWVCYFSSSHMTIAYGNNEKKNQQKNDNG